ncbi:MAG TPA: PAS domain S-box protein [Bacteroidales bacterium]|nr:PAS domain S-box protein [Bacteroidales bacterium]
MNEEKRNNILADIVNTETFVTALVAGMTFPFAAWIIEFVRNRITVSFAGIGTIHSNNPLLWIIDMAPVVLIIGAFLLDNKRKRSNAHVASQLSERDARINNMAEFAKQIGEGKYHTELTVSADHDIMAQSLLIMRDNLLQNTRKETEQSWIAEGKETISDILRQYNKIDELATQVIRSLVTYSRLVQGALYIYDEDRKILVNEATFAYNRNRELTKEFELGYGLIGQCAYEMDYVYRTEIPADYVTISSGLLGDQKPRSLLLIPLITDEKLQGVMEFASLEDQIPNLTIRFLKELGEIIARTFSNLKINQRTEKLLLESQQMTLELQENEEELRQNAEEMRATQEELKKSNEHLEAKILEVENAQKRQFSLLENASEIIAIYDENMVMKYESPSVIKILGFTPEEMMHGKDIDRLTRKGETSMRGMFKQLLASPGEPVTIQYTYMKKNGQKIFLEATGRNLLNDPAIEGIIINSTDITERKRAEREERLKSKMQALSENSLDLIIRLSTVGQFFYANPIVTSFMGIDPMDLINKTLNEIGISTVLLNYFRESIDNIKSYPNKTQAEITIPALIDGRETDRIMSFAAIPEFNENELETILFVGHDITEAKQIEHEIQDKNRKIEDSINYAQRIQTSILPDIRLVREHLPKSFIYYKPRDVVSGDFPWFFNRGNDIYIAAVDCTGHGVPGALLSFVGYFLLNNIVDRDHKISASEVCDLLHFGVRKTLKQESEEAEARDGMDIAFCKINHIDRELQYAGAHRPLFLLRHGELIEYKGNRKAIGGIPHRKKEEENFTNYMINYKRGDKFFFFSDGLPDQLGGPEDKKYSPKRIRELILENKDLPIEKYSNLFSEDFETWKGDGKQIDDVLLIGIEF